ncbi:hypothetical protein H4F99_09310 [Lysobacter sp. SG-8]|uniref:Peptidase n=1 Tax=Marilutibacter penaei TaxID=2759900 RepID=A0A7W3U488_9GAMM|nr:hypothetical protein [Lysobacter penaei]MBB1088686.1 hypothetical protein [Lysobacter penaei]
MRRVPTVAVSVLCALLAACSAPPADPPASGDSSGTPAADAPVGGDRDAQGCIPSAGYRWCERSQACERPWELAEREGFPNEAGRFEEWCASTPGPAAGPVAG